jgi:hypothetical protein
VGEFRARPEPAFSRSDLTLASVLHLQYYCMIGILYRDPFISARALFAEMTMLEAVEIQKSAARSTQEIIVSLNVSDGGSRLLLAKPDRWYTTLIS